MALIERFVAVSGETARLHEPVDCGWRHFTVNGRTILQLDTYGRRTRQHPGKISQSIQLDREAASVLVSLLREVFDDL